MTAIKLRNVFCGRGNFAIFTHGACFMAEAIIKSTDKAGAITLNTHKACFVPEVTTLSTCMSCFMAGNLHLVPSNRFMAGAVTMRANVITMSTCKRCFMTEPFTVITHKICSVAETITSTHCCVLCGQGNYSECPGNYNSVAASHFL